MRLKLLNTTIKSSLLIAVALAISAHVFGQKATATARLDARQVMVGDQARLFIEIQHNPAHKLQWATIPDTFNNLEVVEKGKIDTVSTSGVITFRQRLLITGFDSGLFRIPPFVFSVIPGGNDTPYTVQTDSFDLLVQTVAVDTTKGFKGIKGIIAVKSSWQDYIWFIVGGLVLIIIVAVVVIYIMKKKPAKPVPKGPVESLTDYTLRMLSELDAKQLWQKNQSKQYYIELTEIIRRYIEDRFKTPAMELTTEEILEKARMVRDMHPYYDMLTEVLHMADLAKFAKFEPLPQEHMDAMEKAKHFVNTSRPIIIVEQSQNTNKAI
ncbi:MAG: hypothetical protein K0Q79_1244 [Flavipsychrobacter sp.]|jgi:hypothetical protein|nr:hypothetical protein [Flavipsychrobacter sp.]